MEDDIWTVVLIHMVYFTLYCSKAKKKVMKTNYMRKLYMQIALTADAGKCRQ